ncbi:MAG TPA: 6-carboxytetrahydropterin synthase [Burkholderiales bacterium]|nr:6-carboxytetrahydropterin synthase [Burkholderiales bacterium]
MSEQLFFTAEAGFEAARQLSLRPAGHRDNTLHGHSFTANVRVAPQAFRAEYCGGEVGSLRDRLARAIEPLDYAFLNQVLKNVADEDIAYWLRDRLELSDVDRVGIRSARDAGVELTANGSIRFWRKYRLETAHQLPNVPPGHKCGRMHGHSFGVVLHVDLPGSEAGIGYEALDRIWAPIREQLNFACLNDFPGLNNPTSEVLSSWLWQRVQPQLPQLARVTVFETASSGAHFDGTHYRIWKDMTFDSAARLKYAGAGDPRRRIHGHTYTLRLHLHAELDRHMGWVVDFGDVKELFAPVFKLIDHHPLYEISGMDDTDVANIARYIRQQSRSVLPQLERIDVYEAEGCGAILAWGERIPAVLV